MNAAETERAIQTAVVSLEMEGLHVEEQYVAWCRKLLSDNISMNEYLAMVVEKVMN